MPLAPNSAILVQPQQLLGSMPQMVLPEDENGRREKISNPHPEWYLHHLRWRWLLDSWEGGEAYRMAVYGFDIKGMPIRNLIRHKREYPSVFEQTYSPQTGRPVGTDQANQATDDDYELRRARTPVPTFVAEAVEAHLAKIYSREVARDGPKNLTEWWQDVDGRSSTVDQWMANTIAPLLLVLGCLDIFIDYPAKPFGAEIRTRADQIRLGLDKLIGSYVLPENVVWWNLDTQGRYSRVVIREVQGDQNVVWRYWDTKVWAIYDKMGEMQGEPVEHDFGMVPMVRLFDRRRPRMTNIGLPRYEAIAEMQREFYNRDSELILSDTTQAHPLLQGPEDYVVADGAIAIGPNWLLPKKKNMSGASASYEGFDWVDPPKGGADSIRTNKQDLRDAVDRSACLTKPAGVKTMGSGTVSQSGISKQLDQSTGNDLLSKISAMLQKNEEQIARLFLAASAQGKPKPMDVEAIKIHYPTSFDLMSADELADIINKYQLLISRAGNSPLVEKALIGRLVKEALRGLADDEYEEMNKEIDAIVLGQGPTKEPTYPDERFDPSATPGSPNMRAMQQALLLDQVSRNPDEMVG